MTTATKAQIATAAAILQPTLARNPKPSTAAVHAAAQAAGIELAGLWHETRILNAARVLDAAALLAEIRAEVAR